MIAREFSELTGLNCSFAHDMGLHSKNDPFHFELKTIATHKKYSGIMADAFSKALSLASKDSGQNVGMVYDTAGIGWFNMQLEKGEESFELLKEFLPLVEKTINAVNLFIKIRNHPRFGGIRLAEISLEKDDILVNSNPPTTNSDFIFSVDIPYPPGISDLMRVRDNEDDPEIIPLEKRELANERKKVGMAEIIDDAITIIEKRHEKNIQRFVGGLNKAVTHASKRDNTKLGNAYLKVCGGRENSITLNIPNATIESLLKIPAPTLRLFTNHENEQTKGWAHSRG